MKNKKIKVLTAFVLSTTMMFGLTSCDFSPNLFQPSAGTTQEMTGEETDMFNYLNTNAAPVTGVQIIESSDSTEDIQIYTNELLDVENVISGVVAKVKENNLDPNTHVLVLTPKNSVEVSVAEWDVLQERVHKFIDVSNIFAKQIVSSSYAYQPAVVDQNGKNSFGEVPVITFIANDYRVNQDFAMEIWERFVHTDVVLKSGNITFQYNHTGVKNTPEEMKDMVNVANEAANIIEDNRMNYRITTFAYGSETAYRSTDYYNDINITFLLNSNGETSTENVDKIKSKLTDLVAGSPNTLGILNEK